MDGPIDGGNLGNDSNPMDSKSQSTSEDIVDGVQYSYMTGFNNQFVTEVLPGAVPKGRNTPRKVPYNLYTEQLSGTAFTAPRSTNKRTWLYRIQPSVSTTSTSNNEESNTASSTTATSSCNNNTRLHKFFGHCNPADCIPTVDPIRWKPLSEKTRQQDASLEESSNPSNGSDIDATKDFIDGIYLMCHAGDASTRYGLAIYQYSNVTQSMTSKYMVNTDGDLLIVPQYCTLQIHTELGRLIVPPSQIVIIPRGIIFSVHPILASTTEQECGAAGYVLEVYTCSGSSFHLPELGPIGSNGLANARDFYYPVAWCETLNKKRYYTPGTIITKKDSELFSRSIDHTPYNVVGWHGNYAPYKYDLHRFCAVNSVTFDHLDPSIYTLLTCPSGTAGVALADFVIFPSRRVLATDSDTLRPPWFHRNVMSEYMGLIYGSYDAKKVGSFVPGGASLHNALTPHGPDNASYQRAVADPCATPALYEGGLAFMFETCLSLKVTPTAFHDTNWRDVTYATDAWGTGLTAEEFTGWE